MKKLIALSLALVLAFGLLGALAQEAPKTDKLVISTTNRTLAEGNDVDKFIEEYLGVEVEWIIASGNDRASKINALSASGDLPDMMVLDNTLYMSLLNQGLLLPLDEYIDECFPNLYAARTEAQIEALRHTDGKLYAFNNTGTVDRSMTLVRKDWLDSLNMDLPTTLDGFYDMLYAFTYSDPDNNGVDDTYGLFLTGDDINGNFNLVLSAFGANAQQWIYKDGEIVFGATQPELAEAVKFMQKLYADGLINKNYLTDDGDARTAAIAANQAGGMYAAFNYADSYWSQYHTTETMAWIGLMGLDGSGVLSWGSPENADNYTCISTTCKDVKLCLKYLNYLASKEAYLYVIKGVEGENWEYTPEGKLVFKEPYKSDNSLLYAQGHTYTYTMPFIWNEYPTFTLDEQVNLDWARRHELEKNSYAAFTVGVPAIVNDSLDAGMMAYIKETIHGLVIGGGDVDEGLKEMVDKLYADYHLEAQTDLAREFAEEKGY